MNCNSEKIKDIGCCELIHKSTYTVKGGYVYCDGILYAKITDAKKNADKEYTTLTAERISDNKYINRQEIYMTMKNDFSCI